MAFSVLVLAFEQLKLAARIAVGITKIAIKAQRQNMASFLSIMSSPCAAQRSASAEAIRDPLKVVVATLFYCQNP
jgi:hypothetical protein